MEKLVSVVYLDFNRLNGCNIPDLEEFYIANEEIASLEQLQVVQEALKKLYEYEHMEEEGLILKLPCKVGDTIYLIKGKKHAEIEELKVMKFVYSNELDIMFSDEIYEVGLISIKEIGKSVFLTEEEAEKALQRLEKENEV